MTTVTSMKDVAAKVLAGGRITPEDGLYLLKEAPLMELGSLAQEVRYRHNPDPTVTFVIDTNLN